MGGRPPARFLATYDGNEESRALLARRRRCAPSHPRCRGTACSARSATAMRATPRRRRPRRRAARSRSTWLLLRRGRRRCGAQEDAERWTAPPRARCGRRWRCARRGSADEQLSARRCRPRRARRRGEDRTVRASQMDEQEGEEGEGGDGREGEGGIGARRRRREAGCLSCANAKKQDQGIELMPESGRAPPTSPPRARRAATLSKPAPSSARRGRSKVELKEAASGTKPIFFAVGGADGASAHGWRAAPPAGGTTPTRPRLFERRGREPRLALPVRRCVRGGHKSPSTSTCARARPHQALPPHRAVCRPPKAKDGGRRRNARAAAAGDGK